MNLVKLRSGDARLAKVDEIYQESFPPEERFPLPILMRLADKGVFTVLAMTENDNTVGMLVISTNEKAAYICFFAVDKDYREKGLGSKALRQVCDLYHDKQIVVSVVPLRRFGT